ncbi:MAG: sigma-70 family RNA polymerase sigma factor [Oscillospiraceae bacterium]|jgi:RNA polymerase sporulation-specific sigma factor|nr:sigma-70 family RNA polymerase sigma factor [Oscillospiraceae bacterium]
MFLKKLLAKWVIKFYYDSSNSFEKPLSAEDETRYLADVRRLKTTQTEDLTEEEILKIVSEAKIARDKLTIHNMRLISRISKNYSGVSDFDKEELVPYGILGLIKAIDGYESEKCAKFSYYASKCITNEMLMYLRKNMKYTGMISLFGAIRTGDGDSDSIDLLDTLVSTENVEELCEFKILADLIIKFIDNLQDERAKFIMNHRYGLNGHNVLIQKDIAKILNCSRTYVSRIETDVKKDIMRYIETAYR